MEVNFENSEIQRITYQEDGFIINTKKESNTILYKELLDIEHKKFSSESEIPEYLTAVAATIVGISLTGGLFTGILVGVPGGMGIYRSFKKLFFEEDKCILTFKLSFDKKISLANG